jgi:hypothetical protein
MTAPRRLQLRRGNSTAISSYTGAAGELVVDTTTNTLYLHDGSTVGGYATTTNTASITNQISSVNANITLANTGMQGYVNLANTIQSAQLTSANLGIIGYVDLANTIQSAQVGAANLAITAANLGMKGYVDSVASQSIYGNGNVKSYLTGGFDGNIIPSANVTYSLGSPTQQWRDLFVSNNTIYISGVPLGIDTTGNLTINGTVIPTISYVNTVVANVVVDLSAYALNANVTAANIGIIGYVDLANTIQSNQISAANLGMRGYVDNQITTITGSAPAILDTLGELANALGADANLSVTITSQIANVNANITTANLGMRGYVDSQSFYSNVKVATYLQYGNPSNISVAGNVTATYFIGNGALLTGIIAGSSYSNVQVATYLPTYSGNISANISKAGYTWTFGTGGTTQFPNSLILAPAGQSITMQSDNYSQLMWENANLTVAPNMAINSNFYVTQNNATLDIGYRDGSSTQIIKSWYWNADGTLTLPASSGQIGRDGYSNGIDLYNNNGGTGYVRMNYADQSVIWGDAGGAHVQSAGTYTWDFDTTGNLKLPSGGYILNSDNSIYGGGDYSNVQVATYLPTYSGVVTASNVAVAGNVTAQYLFGNGSQLTGIIAGSSYSNVQVATYLPTYSGVVTASNVAVAGNVTAIRFFGDGGTLSNVTFNVAGNVTGTSSNVTLQAGAYTSVFDNQGNVTVPRLFTAGNIQTAGYLFGNGALLTGIVAGSSYSNVQVETYLPTYAGTVSASLVNTSGNVLSSGLSVFGNTRIGLAGVVSGQFHSVVGNITQTSSGGAVYINTTGNILAAAVVAGAVTSTGTVAVNAATGITTNQATFLLANATATTINMGGAAATIRMGTITSNVFVGSAIGNSNKELTLRAQGTWNIATSIDSNGGFNSPPYTNQLVIGGSGTGMTANYSASGGYLTTLTIYNPGTGYRNGDVLSVPGGIAGNTFTLTNYSSTLTGNSAAAYTFGIEGNLIVPGNVTARNFIGGGALLTTLPGYAYGNVNVAAYLNATGYNLYSNVNVANYLTTATITTTGNVTAGNLITGGALYVANITTTGASGNISGANYITANVILTNGGWGNISQVANIQANAVLVSGNITATYFLGNGALLTGIVADSSYSNVQVATYLPTYSGVVGASNVFVSGNVTAQYFLGNGALLTGIASSYSNVQVATYLPTYSGNIANVRLSSSGALTFPDGSQQTTAAFGGGGNYGNANVAAFLPTYTGTTGITAVGTLATLSVTGNTTVGNLVGTEANTRIIANVYTTTFDIYGNVSFPGNIITPTGLYVGPTLFTALPNTIAQFTGNANSYAQINFENLSSGTDATADYVATANNGTDTTFFVDLGIANSNYDNASPNNSLGTAVFANDSYLYAQGNLATTTGGNLVIGTSTANKSVKIFAGGINSANIVATVSNTGVAVTGNVTANYFVGSGSLLSGVATKITGSWTVPTGNSTQSFTVASGTYQLWVDCNIPNGILAWNATATVTNSNVPVVGQQFAWVYNGGGTPIDFTSIPNQFVGTGNTIVRSSVSPSTTTNRFDFGINNTSGGNVTVSYGYVKIS